jgi:hypothetical protein
MIRKVCPLFVKYQRRENSFQPSRRQADVLVHYLRDRDGVRSPLFFCLYPSEFVIIRAAHSEAAEDDAAQVRRRANVSCLTSVFVLLASWSTLHAFFYLR